MIVRVLPLVSIVGLIGCAEPVDATLTHQSVMQQRTTGLALHRSGERGHAGMRHTNCPFETQAGGLTGDYDLPEDDEEVVDAGEDPQLGIETVLLTQPGRIHLLNKESGDYDVATLEVAGVRTARLSDRGVVALVDGDQGCEVVWTGGEDRVPLGCGAGFAVDPEEGIAWVGGKDLDRVDPDGVTTVPVDGDLLAWDRATRALYVARSGDTVVRAVEEDGSLRWEAEVDGPISALEHGGPRGAAVVSWEGRDGTGRISWLDGWTGRSGSDTVTPAAAPALEMSDNGRMLAVILETEAHFYRVD